MLKKTYPYLPTVFFLIGISFFCLRVLGFNFEFLPGDAGDARFINFLMEHGYQWISGNVDDFWNAQFMFPFEDSIAFSDNMLGSMPIYSFFRVFGVQPETAFQLWWITVCSLNYWCAYIVLKKWFGRTDLAIAGALIFAFSIFQQGQMNYLQMSVRFMIPIVIYAAMKLVQTGKPKYFAFYALGIIYQLYCAMYLGMFLLYFSFGFMVLYVLFTKQYLFFLPLFKKENLIKTGAVLAVAITFGMWLIIPYSKMAAFAGVPLYPDVVPYLPTVSTALNSHEAGWLMGNVEPSFHKIESFWLHRNFPGFLLLLALLATPFILFEKWFRKANFSKELMAVALSALIIVLLYLRTEDGFSLYKAVFKLPGMASIRVLNRFLHVEIFLLILVLLYLWNKIPKKYSYILFVLIILDNGFNATDSLRLPKENIVHGRLHLENELNKNWKNHHKAFAVIDTVKAAPYVHVEAMMVSAKLQHPTVNGYSSGCPGGFGNYFSNTNEQGAKEWMDINKLKEKDVLFIDLNK